MNVEIKDDRIVIELPKDALPQIVEGAWAAGYIQTRYKVTDPELFANDLLRALRDESEDGTTRVHRMFDQAIEHAIDYGAEGVEEHEDQEA